MIPRIHKRGSSFKAASQYILHDPNSQSRDRVAFSQTCNLGDVATDDAWHAMYDTWNDRTRLKRESQTDLRGRDNKKPVFHYTLSWHPDERPTEALMMEAARSSLKALGLEQHQALMAAHNDTDHPHLHIVVNTVHPETGRTASLKYSKLELSKWAEDYERQHGIRTEQRINNNAERERRRQDPQQTNSADMPKGETRQRATLHRQALDRLQRLRLEYDHRHMVERNVTTARHRIERGVHFDDARSATGVALAYLHDRFKSRWRDLYEAQRLEAVHVKSIQSSPLERAVYVMMNAHRLGSVRTLSKKDQLRLIASPTKLFKAVDAMHGRERHQLSNVQKAETHARLEKISLGLESRLAAQRVQHRAELDAEKSQRQTIKAHAVDYRRARNQIILEERFGEEKRMAPNAPPMETDQQYIDRTRDDMAAHYERNSSPDMRAFWDWWREQQNAPKPAPQVGQPEPTPPSAAPPFEQAATPTRAQQIKMDAAAWRARNPDKDFGNER